MVVEPERTEVSMRNPLASSASAMNVSRPATPEVRIEQVDPAYVNTQRELEETFQEMHQWFQDKESEANWFKREQSCTKLRRLNAGNAPSDYHDAFLAGIKSRVPLISSTHHDSIATHFVLYCPRILAQKFPFCICYFAHELIL